MNTSPPNILVAPLPLFVLNSRHLMREHAPVSGYDIISKELFGMYRLITYLDGKIIQWYPDCLCFIWEDKKRVYIPPMMEYFDREADRLLLNLGMIGKEREFLKLS